MHVKWSGWSQKVVTGAQSIAVEQRLQLGDAAGGGSGGADLVAPTDFESALASFETCSSSLLELATVASVVLVALMSPTSVTSGL